jgi:hypothetical protein
LETLITAREHRRWKAQALPGRCVSRTNKDVAAQQSFPAIPPFPRRFLLIRPVAQFFEVRAMLRLLSRCLSSEIRTCAPKSGAQRRPELETLEDRTVPAIVFPLPPAAPATAPLSSNPSTAYVQILYLDVLGRNATTPEINYWTNVVNSSGTSQAASGILNSPESQNHIVDNLYMNLLGRHADGGGLRYWDGVLAGEGLEAVTAGLVSSHEFLSKHPGNAVSAEYQTLLGRAPSATELAYWTPVLSKEGPTAVARGIEASPEFMADVTQFLFVQEVNQPATADQLFSFANNPSLNLLQIEATVLQSAAFLQNVGL